MKLKDLLKEESISTYNGDIRVPSDWTDLSQLSTEFPGYTSGCKVNGDFFCYVNQHISSLEGGPSIVTGDFYCQENPRLTSLKGAPHTVGGNFICRDCVSLTSLEGAPTTLLGTYTSLSGKFECSGCTSLTSLKGAPTNPPSHFYCGGCALTSLEGGPETVGGNFNCDNSIFTSLEGAPISVGESFYANKCNNITSLQGIGKKFLKTVGAELEINVSKRLQFGLGIMLITNIRSVKLKDKTLTAILNTLLKNRSDLLDAKEQLMNAGYKAFAKL